MLDALDATHRQGLGIQPATSRFWRPMTQTYYGHYNRVLLAMLPPDLTSVLEFGCGEGALAQRYRETNPCRWVGVEAFPAAAAKAGPHMTRCVAGDADDVSSVRATLLDEPRFSALVYADSLEHFRDPAGSLAAHLDFLEEDGRVFVSLPNAQHWTMLRELFEGRFEYVGEGLFDYTHLHFFTLGSTDRMFAKLGLHRRAARPIIPIETAPLLGGSEKRASVLAAAAVYMGRPLSDQEAILFDSYQIVMEYGRASTIGGRPG